QRAHQLAAHGQKLLAIDRAAKGEFPHSVWGKGKIVFTSVHLKEIALLREVRSTNPSPASVRMIGTRAQGRQKYS
ncbi:hypothetical protein, partial [uncultured Arthrobacter sp.]|uniref:hypothetical protein n=1 Tax=uncultured Arthrobacter sp. TaxID=114050 RepID=UPI0032176374